MSDEHQAAIAAGRIEANAIRDYLDALEAVEQGFITHAASYGQRKGIRYATWREAGVPAELLARAGITRGQ